MRPSLQCVRTLLVFHYFFNKPADIADVELVKDTLSIADYSVDLGILGKVEMS